jgi:hypothetical protein
MLVLMHVPLPVEVIAPEGSETFVIHTSSSNLLLTPLQQLCY